MINRGSAPRLLGAALATVGISALVAGPAAAQRGGIERVLAGIRLNSTAKAVLQKYGNPQEIVIGDVGVRAPSTPQGGQGVAAGNGAMGGFGGAMGMGAPGGMAAMMGGRRGGAMGMGAPGGMGAGAPGGMAAMMSQAYGGRGGAMGMGAPGGAAGGPPAGMAAMMSQSYGAGRGGAMGMGGGGLGRSGKGGEGDDGGAPGMSASMMGMGGPRGAMMGGFGGTAGMNVGTGTSAFGLTTSTLAQQQEVTWIYNRKFKDAKGADNIVSYEFLIGADGRVAQIRTLGYNGGGVRTQRGIVLGSTYRDVIRLYGYPEEQTRNGDILIASYKNRAHAQFQFLPTKNTNNVADGGFRVIAVTIASIE